MTYQELYEQIRHQMEEAGCDSPAFEADCLLEDIGGLPHLQRALYMNEIVPELIRQEVETAVRQRINGRPLQYILKMWNFLSLSLHVGEGVLIPRPETELLCEWGADWLKKNKLSAPVVWDLCAGTGCVGLGLRTLYPEARVTVVEYSEAACYYLRHNCTDYKELGVRMLRADITQDVPELKRKADLILCNPPYIPTADLAGLMTEVQYEPVMALDGSEDGLKFYRVLAERWVPRLKSGGMMAVEIGIDQTEPVVALFKQAGLQNIQVLQDYSGIDRVVSGEKPKSYCH